MHQTLTRDGLSKEGKPSTVICQKRKMKATQQAKTNKKTRRG